MISLTTQHKNHLSLLIKQPNQVIIDFCKLSIDFLQNGPNTTLYSSAAEKLSVTEDVIENCIYGLLNLLLLSVKKNLNDNDFNETILSLGFNLEQQVILNKFYSSKKDEISKVISKIEINDLHYDNLNWRFEVHVASRSLLHQVTPLYLLDFNFKINDKNNVPQDKNILLQTDITNLVHITQELEKALKESESRHTRKIQRSLNN